MEDGELGVLDVTNICPLGSRYFKWFLLGKRLHPASSSISMRGRFHWLDMISSEVHLRFWVLPYYSLICAFMTNKPLAAALEVISPVLNSKVEGQAVVAAKCMGLMHGYDARWLNSPYLIDEVESVLTSDLYNPATERKSRTFTSAGKLDVQATEKTTGKKVLFDHKTSSEDISDPNADYWRQLVVESQATHYMLLEHLNGQKVDAALWDVVRKPGIGIRALTKIEKKEFYDTGKYFGTQFDTDEMDKVEVDPKERETPLLYAARLAHDCVNERPQWYFQRRMIPRLDSEVMEYASDQWDIGQDIIHARANNRWPRNSGACMLYHSPCKFLGVCSNHDTIDSDKWQRLEWVHPELPIVGQNGGRDILTNSRMRTFQTCKRLAYYKYELGVGRVDEEEKESLFFGSLFHLALEQFFLTLQKQQ